MEAAPGSAQSPEIFFLSETTFFAALVMWHCAQSCFTAGKAGDIAWRSFLP